MPDTNKVVHWVLPPWLGLGVQCLYGHRYPPMPIYVLSALARREGWTAVPVDLNYEKLPKEDPDLVGIVVWTMLAPQAYALADQYRARGIKVVLGGVHASMLPGEALRHADAIVVGEAESVMGRLLDDAAAGRMEGVYQGTWGDMTAVPKVDEWIDIHEKQPYFRYVPKNTLQSTRGCRFNCDFCSVIRINGRGSRHRDPAEVVEELKVLSKRGQRFGSFCHVAFLDDDFASDLEYTAEMAEAILSSGLKISWSAQASIGLSRDPKVVDLVAKAGLTVIFTGFESTSRETLIECNKKNRPSMFGESIQTLHDHKILVEGGFIFGFDHDEPDVFEHTVAFIDNIKVDSAHMAILTPLPGTQTFARMAQANRIRTYNWGAYDLYHCVFEPAQMTAEQLEAGLWQAYHDFYARRPRLRRWRRHVGMGLRMTVGGVITKTNMDFAKQYRPGRDERPRYEADPADIKTLLV
ncbi:MAG: B12-binding domain-containing radical SAM protein, partial [Acidimicrobiales bacterium]